MCGICNSILYILTFFLNVRIYFIYMPTFTKLFTPSVDFLKLRLLYVGVDMINRVRAIVDLSVL